VKSNKQTIQELRGKLIQIKGNISVQIMSEEVNKAIIKQLRERQKQLHENIE
jgi:hypothetical protein